MKLDPLAGLATPTATPVKRKPLAIALQAASKAGAMKTPGTKAVPKKTAPKPVPQNLSPIRNARS